MHARIVYVISLLFILALLGCKSKGASTPKKLPNPCTKAWFALVQSVTPVGDGKKRGPEPGSKEWMDALSKKLDVEAKPSNIGKRDWCKKVDRKLFRK